MAVTRQNGQAEAPAHNNNEANPAANPPANQQAQGQQPRQNQENAGAAPVQELLHPVASGVGTHARRLNEQRANARANARGGLAGGDSH